MMTTLEDGLILIRNNSNKEVTIPLRFWKQIWICGKSEQQDLYHAKEDSTDVPDRQPCKHATDGGEEEPGEYGVE